MLHNFNSIQEAFNYIFEGYNIDILEMHNSPHPWFIADQIRLALEFKVDNYDMLRYLSDKDKWVKVYNISTGKISDFNANRLSPSKLDMVTLNFDVSKFPPSLINYINSKDSRARRFLIVSLPGLFELIFRSRTSKARDFRIWLCEIVLPTLYNNPILVQQIKYLSEKYDQLNMQYNQLINQYNKLNTQHMELQNDYNYFVDNYNDILDMVNYLDYNTRIGDIAYLFNM